ncbi:MAG: Zn-dependent exopeptidase M28 [Oligoflexales bacterium]|nr:Zn-dependent exopeptidase M28 [Oligoflexales bacterium]
MKRLQEVLALLLFLASSVSCICTRQNHTKSTAAHDIEVGTLASQFKLDTSKAAKDLEYFTSAPHSFGSERQRHISQYLLNSMMELSLPSKVQEFSALTPNPNYAEGEMQEMLIKKDGYNVLTLALADPPVKNNDNKDCLVILGSHYDTKIVAGIDYVGANDSASSSILLIQLMRFFQQHRKKLSCSILGVWFDGEEAVLTNWDEGLYNHAAKVQDNTYGSRYLADKMQNCDDPGKLCLNIFDIIFKVENVIVIDMLGSENLTLTRDSNSTPVLLEKMLVAADLYNVPVNKNSKAIEDDHIPFKLLGIPVLNIIDFNNLQFWHTHGDEAQNISFDSLEKSGKIAAYCSIAK